MGEQKLELEQVSVSLNEYAEGNSRNRAFDQYHFQATPVAKTRMALSYLFSHASIRNHHRDTESELWSSLFHSET